MKIAVDLDGVCYHWERTARYMLRRWYAQRGEHHPQMLDRESLCWDDIQHNVSPDAWRYLWTDAVREGLYRHGHIVGGTIEALTRLAADGYELVIATARPREAVEDTFAWCALHFRRVPLSAIHITAEKLSAPADIYIDDAEHNATAIAAAGKLCLLFDRPWNYRMPKTKNVERVYGWRGVLDALRDTNLVA